MSGVNFVVDADGGDVTKDTDYYVEDDDDFYDDVDGGMNLNCSCLYQQQDDESENECQMVHQPVLLELTHA